jgi:DtxR family transcriptional regulator, Mn-dependent transcriptional regulator
MATGDHFGESAEMYLKSIVELSDELDDLPISSLAERLGISHVSATEMIHRMQDRRLVDHTPYKGVRLTRTGWQSALSVIRRHRLWERFLHDHLRLSWAAVHDLACSLEHAVGGEVSEALAEWLGHPPTCPHGNPIPGADGRLPSAAGLPLSRLDSGRPARIVRIRPESRVILDYLEERNLKPGVALSVIDIEPLDGPLLLAVGDQRWTLGRNLAAHVLVAQEGE